MKHMNRGAIIALTALPLLALAGACTMDTGEDVASTALELGRPSRVHLMPVGPPSSEPGAEALIDTSAPPGAHLQYYGGPVISNVKVWVVFWGGNVDNQSTLTSFYSTITSSPYFDWLTEYNTPTQTIGHGSLGGSFTDPSPPSGSQISDEQIQAELAKLIDGGQLPPNDENNLYMVHFPPGVSITQAGNRSCVQFCAYHGTFTHGGKNAYYGVMPDLGGGCGQGCGGGSKVDNTTAVSAHELVESVTDPGVGLAQNPGPPLAWYDQQRGEIADICGQQHGVVSGYTVCKEFSNQANDCIVTKSGGGGPGGGGGGGRGGGGGQCAHPLCAPGQRLSPYCDPCVAKVCSYDQHCCAFVWDGSCVNEAQALCGQMCH